MRLPYVASAILGFVLCTAAAPLQTLISASDTTDKPVPVGTQLPQSNIGQCMSFCNVPEISIRWHTQSCLASCLKIINSSPSDVIQTSSSANISTSDQTITATSWLGKPTHVVPVPLRNRPPISQVLNLCVTRCPRSNSTLQFTNICEQKCFEHLCINNASNQECSSWLDPHHDIQMSSVKREAFTPETKGARSLDRSSESHKPEPGSTMLTQLAMDELATDATQSWCERHCRHQDYNPITDELECRKHCIRRGGPQPNEISSTTVVPPTKTSNSAPGSSPVLESTIQPRNLRPRQQQFPALPSPKGPEEANCMAVCLAFFNELTNAFWKCLKKCPYTP